MKHNRNALVGIVFGLLVLVVIAGCAAAKLPSPTSTPAPEGVTVVQPPSKVTDFTLTNTQDKPANFSDFKGKFVLFSFGYTHCPDVCPVTLGRYKQIKDQLGDTAKDLTFMFISVDGERDTPSALGSYLGLFDPEFIGLTGKEAALRTITKQFGATFSYNNKDTNPTDYTVAHTASWFLVSRDSNLVRVYSYDTKPEIAATDIKSVITAKS